LLQQLVTLVPDQVRDDGPGVHVERLKVAGYILAFPEDLPPFRHDENGFLIKSGMTEKGRTNPGSFSSSSPRSRIESGAGSSQVRNDGIRPDLGSGQALLSQE
jgi:hypothetical protein